MAKKQRNPVNWFELPVKNMERAMKFYKAVFGYSLDRTTTGPMDMAFFPSEPKGWGCSGMLVKRKTSKLGDGTIVYFVSPSGDIANELKKVKKAGGKVHMPKTSIGEYGFMGIFMDTEGNVSGMQSMK